MPIFGASNAPSRAGQAPKARGAALSRRGSPHAAPNWRMGGMEAALVAPVKSAPLLRSSTEADSSA
ncbi:hypothetical protein C6V07_05780 [Burkholderia gladioli]|nr:hypothetical protein C6V07_05780 [Burkholderia gladioli]